MTSRLARVIFFGLMALGLLSGCTTLARQNAVPPALHGKVEIDNMPNIRYLFFSQNGVNQMLKDIETGDQEPLFKTSDRTKTANYLSISGGGDNGAFGAGLLSGWSERGDRPEFQLVTGVSTGALIAPFAFLGPDYDYVLKHVYTQIKPDDVFINLGLTGALFGDAFADTTPLFKLIQEFVTPELLRKIAFEYTMRNRWLLVA